MSSGYAFNYPFNITGNCKTDTSTLHRWSEAVSAKTQNGLNAKRQLKRLPGGGFNLTKKEKREQLLITEGTTKHLYT